MGAVSNRRWTLFGIAIAVVAALLFAHVVSTRPWNSTASASCDDLASRHLAAQVDFLASQEASASALGAIRDSTFAELGIACGWEEAQAADMAAYVDVAAQGLDLPTLD